MIDLFGLKKGSTEDAPVETTSGQQAPSHEAPGGSHRLWAVLLVVDSVFVIVFGGAVAAKVYQYWKAPLAPSSPVVVRHRPPKEQPPVKPPETPPTPPEQPDKPPKTAEPPPRPPATAEPPQAKPAAPSPAIGRPKAQPVEFKLRAADAKSVQLIGAFIVHGGRKEMSRKGDGTWTLTLYLHPGRYRYFFSVDRKKLLDPENPHSDRGASVMTLE